jgi:hypothetical protein
VKTEQLEYDSFYNQKQDFILKAAKTALDSYTISRSWAIKLSRAFIYPLTLFLNGAKTLINIVDLFFTCITIVILMPFLVLSSTILLFTLIYTNIYFAIFHKSILTSFSNLDRRSAIVINLKFQRSIKKLELLKRSKFLFNSFLIGPQMHIFLRNVKTTESALHKTAYPDFGTIPSVITIHEKDPNDPWQDEDDYNSEDLITLPKNSALIQSR